MKEPMNDTHSHDSKPAPRKVGKGLALATLLVGTLGLAYLYGKPLISGQGLPGKSVAPVVAEAAPASLPDAAPAAPTEDRDARIAAFASKVNIQMKSIIDLEKGVKLVSYTTDSGKQGGVFYSFPDGTYLAGQLYDTNGELLTDKHFAQAWPDGPPTPESGADLAKAAEALTTAAVATVTKKGPAIYMLYEPHCGFCQKSYQVLKNLDVTVNYLPVSFLTPDSEALVAAILSGEAGIMDKVNDPAQRQGLIERFQAEGPNIRDKAEHNAQIMRLAGISGTPAYLWVGKDGAPGVQRGYLDEAGLKEMLAQAAIDQGVEVAGTPPVATTP